MTTMTPESPATRRQFRVVGHNLPRVDGLEKVTGRGRYVADLSLPGMLIGKILRSPYPHARIVRLDPSRALALPGVVAVVTGADTPGLKWGEFKKDIYPLAIGKVRYVGEEVAVVTAVDAETAEEALALIDVVYEELPAVFDPHDALQPEAPLIHSEAPGNTVWHLSVDRGDPDGAMAQADVVVEDTFHSRTQWHGAIEPTGTLASYSVDGKLTVWTNCNGTWPVREMLVEAFGLRMRDVRVIQPLVGGAFGGRGHDNNVLVAAIAAIKSRRPVKIINKREEDFIATRPRVPMEITIKAGFSKDGRMIAKTIKTLADNGAYASNGPSVTRVATMRHDHMWLNTNIRSILDVVYTNNIPRGSYRGFGNPSGQWAMQQIMDEAAVKLGIDPKVVLLTNAIEGNHTSPHGSVILSCELKACIERTAALIDWDTKRANKRPNHGMGIAASVMVSGRRSKGDYDGSNCAMDIDLDGNVQIWFAEGDTGNGTRTMAAMMAAEVLGVKFEDVTVSEGDTSTSPFGHGAHGSRATYIAGNAVAVTAQNLRQRVLEVASEMMEVDATDLEIAESVVRVKGAPERHMTLGEVAHTALVRRNGYMISATGSWDPPSTMSTPDQYGNESGSYNFAAGAFEVEVDPATGVFTILDVAVAMDGGTIINPKACEGQNEGSVAQGLGYAFIEDIVAEEGRLQNPNFSDYRMPVALDMPPLKQEFVPSYEPTGPLGAKGVSQIGLDTIGPALANAIYDAVGVRITSLPITPEKVYRALREKEQRGNAGANGTVEHGA
jgi:CO/xanthine dehydrogenase Mo-binding subunit